MRGGGFGGGLAKPVRRDHRDKGVQGRAERLPRYSDRHQTFLGVLLVITQLYFEN